jgi:hypothetical protein
MLIDQMKEAAKRATDVTVASDDLGVYIKVRQYGFLIEGCREVGEDLHRVSKMVLWGQMESAVNNALLEGVEGVISELQKPV